jgi:predicted negative regulator of RcsB-dependent stress response
MDWLQLYSRQISIAAAAILVVIGGVWFYKKAHEKQAQNASVALGEAAEAVAAGNLPLAQSDLEKIINRYGDTPSGHQARIFLAQVFYEKKDFAKGIEQLEKLTNSDDKMTRAAAYNLQGAGYEQEKKFEQAAATYRKAADAAGTPAFHDTYMANAARALTSAGKTAEAKEIWTKLAADPDSPAAAEARVRLGEIEAKAAKQA